MAYAAVISVFNTIKELLDSPRISVTSFTREILQYAYDQAWLEGTLKLSWCSEVVRASNEEIIIIEESRCLQDAIESAVSTQWLHQSKICMPSFSLNLDHLKQDVDRFAEMAQEMKGRIEELWEQKVRMVIDQYIVEICVPQKEEEEEEEEDVAAAEMIGLDDEYQFLRRILACTFMISAPYFYETVFCVTGMAGVGKTTLAKRFYNDPMVKAYFECWAFVRVGRGYWRERVMRSLKAQLKHGNEKMIKEGDSLEDILESLQATFRNNDFLIVLDDLWDYDFLDYMQELCGNTVRRSMILVTSRLEPNYRFHSFKLRFMNEDESWELLRKKVFGEEVCPSLLLEPGKKIAKRCGGLPLLINAVAPILLQKAEKDPESWKRVAEKPNSVLEEASIQISEVLLTSYYELSEIHKLYFLYVAIFPESYDVLCSTINNLLYAEGFHLYVLDNDFSSRKSAIAQALLENNLVLVNMGERWIRQEIKSCTIHCAYWYINKRVARDNRFLYIMNSYADGMDEVVEGHHRLAIQTNMLLAINEVFDNISSISTVRSLICTDPYNQYEVPIYFEWRMLRVLDVVTIRFYEFPMEVVTLVLLRYLALTCNANLPPSISKLWNLEFLIVRQHWRIKRVGVESFLPVEVWDLQELIHLEIVGRNLPQPPHPGVVLPNLTHLLDVGIECCAKGVIDNIPKLRKLRVQIELAPDAVLAPNAAEYLTCYCDVKSLQCTVMNPTLLRRPLPRPRPLSVPILHYVDKLSLGGLGYPWSAISYIAGLPNLSVLKLLNYAFRGEKWEVNEEMGFTKLTFLYIEDTDLVQWTIKDENFQKLWKLKMKNCYKLHEIPVLDHISSIVLIDCNPLAESSVRQRYSEQSLGYRAMRATYSWKEKKKPNSA